MLLPPHRALARVSGDLAFLDPITEEEVYRITPAMRRLLSPTAHRMTQREIEEMPTVQFYGPHLSHGEWQVEIR